MLIRNNEDLGRYQDDLDRLYIQCFNGLRLSESDPADLRSVQLEGSKVVSHSAIRKQRFDFIADPSIETYILGYVCTDNALRGKGYATKTISEIVQAVNRGRWIMVLTCDSDKIPFYRKHGFEVISDKARQEHYGKMEIDDVNVMVLCSDRKLKKAIRFETIPFLGEEF